MSRPQPIEIQHPTRPRVSEVVSALAPSGIRAFFDLVIGRDDIVSLGVGEPDFATPWCAREAAIYRITRGETCYTSNSGLLSLRQAVASYLDGRFDVKADPEEEILITVGASEGLDVAMRAILNPGDEVIVWEPYFVAYAPLVQMAGGVPVPLQARGEDGFKFDIQHFESLITPRTRAVLLNYPNNPTGVTLRRDELEVIARIAVRNEMLIISDEIYAELTHDGKHVSMAAIPEAADWTLVLSGFSKAFAMTGWRVGFAVGPADVIAAMRKVHQYSMMCASVMSQRAAEAALNEGMDEMEAMCEIFRQRRNVIVEGFNSVGLPCHKPEGAFYAFPSIKHTGLSSMEFCSRLLEEEKVAIVPGDAFGPAGEGYVRAAYAVGFDSIEKAINGIGRFLKKI